MESEGKSGEGVRRRGSQGERPNLGRTDENFEHTPHRHTHNTTGDPAQGGLGQESLARRSMAQKSRHEQQIVPKSSPIGESFFWVKDGSQRFGHKTVC